jgi:hypothetical protein
MFTRLELRRGLYTLILSYLLYAYIVTMFYYYRILATD